MSQDKEEITSLFVKDKMGRPRKWDREQLAQELIEWALKPDSLNLLGFTEYSGVPSQTLIRIKTEDPNFRAVYITVKDLIGMKREQAVKDNKLNLHAFKFNALTYDSHAVQTRREETEFDSKLRKQENESYSKDDLDRHEKLMEQLKSMQKD